MASNQTAPQETRGSTRITVTLPEGDYLQVCTIAAAARVSASWVVREAVNHYVNRDLPLFAATAREDATKESFPHTNGRV